MTEREKPERRDEDGRIFYDGPQDVPEFGSDEEEAAWYSSHTPSDAYWAKAIPTTLEEAIADANREAAERRDAQKDVEKPAG